MGGRRRGGSIRRCAPPPLQGDTFKDEKERGAGSNNIFWAYDPYLGHQPLISSSSILLLLRLGTLDTGLGRRMHDILGGGQLVRAGDVKDICVTLPTSCMAGRRRRRRGGGGSRCFANDAKEGKCNFHQENIYFCCKPS